jgi:polar amino acid transport system substrate-binding protein
MDLPAVGLPMGADLCRSWRAAALACCGWAVALGGLPLAPAALAQSPAAQPSAAQGPESVLQRIARTGQLRLVGPADHPPLLSGTGQAQAQGYGWVVAQRIAAVVSAAVGRPVELRYEPVRETALLSQRLGEGQAELACTLPFTWAHEEVLDFTLPIGVSGLRLMAPSGRFDGSVAALAGRRIGVVSGSLAATQLQGMQPKARAQGFADLPAALAALSQQRVEGVIGDSALLAGLAQQQGLKGLALTPEVPYVRYAVACAVPENNSAFRGLVNRAIAGLLQGYVDGNPADVAAINRWLGPGSVLNLPAEQIRGVFDALLIGVEPLRPVPATPATQPR